jgi:hypothetical protein
MSKNWKAVLSVLFFLHDFFSIRSAGQKGQASGLTKGWYGHSRN